MDTTDDALGLGGNDTSLPATQTVTAKKTATAKPQESEEAKRKRKRRTSQLSQPLGAPILGQQGLLGVGQGL